jgi:hypothetical protein
MEGYCSTDQSPQRAIVPREKKKKTRSFFKFVLERNSTCFGQFLCSSQELFTVHSAMVYVIQACRQLSSSRIRMELHGCYSKAVYTPVWHIPLLSVQWIIPDDGHRNCPKHVEFHFQNKSWEISESSWFYYREICHDARSHECKILNVSKYFTSRNCIPSQKTSLCSNTLEKTSYVTEGKLPRWHHMVRLQFQHLAMLNSLKIPFMHAHKTTVVVPNISKHIGTPLTVTAMPSTGTD